MNNSTTNRPSFDPSGLLEMVGEDRGFLDEIVTLFGEDSRRMRQSLRDGLELGDAKAIERAAHSLKGMLGHFGPSIAHDLSSELETRSARQDLVAAEFQVNELCREIELISGELSRL